MSVKEKVSEKSAQMRSSFFGGRKQIDIERVKWREHRTMIWLKLYVTLGNERTVGELFAWRGASESEWGRAKCSNSTYTDTTKKRETLSAILRVRVRSEAESNCATCPLLAFGLLFVHLRTIRKRNSRPGSLSIFNLVTRICSRSCAETRRA